MKILTKVSTTCNKLLVEMGVGSEWVFKSILINHCTIRTSHVQKKFVRDS
jgi:hypothetical protein